MIKIKKKRIITKDDTEKREQKKIHNILVKGNFHHFKDD